MSGIQEASVRSIRPYKTSEQYLYAMKEDLAEWLKELYDVGIDVQSFLDVLETGVLLCHHANNITQVARDLNQGYPNLGKRLQLPIYGVTCNDFAQPGTFQARDNVSNFIQWCRKEMDIKEVLMFETEDLVLRKNEKNFVLCLLEVARRASRFGMSAPVLIQMEEDIEDEIREDMNLPPDEALLPRPKREPPNFKNLDQMVQHLVSRCTCPVQFSMVKISEGKYRIGDSNTLIFVRILRNHVMVRVGGGWDTLEHYLDKHDPCRCTSLSHKQALKMASPQKMQGTQVQHEITARLTPRKDSGNKPQPALIVSRCQSPLPPVEWRSYQPHSLGSSGYKKAQASSNNGGSKKNEGSQMSKDHTEPRKGPSIRVRERPATPSQTPLGTGERPGSKQTVSPRSGRETYCVSLSSQQNGSVESISHGLKYFSGPRSRREPGRIETAAWNLKTEIKKPAPPGTTLRRDEAFQPAGNSQRAVNSCSQICFTSPEKHFKTSNQQTVKVPKENLQRQQKGTLLHNGRKDSVAQLSSSPTKHTAQVQRENTCLRTSGKVGSLFSRPPTPRRNEAYQGLFRNSDPDPALDKEHLQWNSKKIPRDEMRPKKEQNKMLSMEAFDSLPSHLGTGVHHLESEEKMKDNQALQGQKNILGTSCQLSPGVTKEPFVEKERVYTPLPINLAEEQAFYRSLEEEILSNIKELEADSEDSHLSGENQLEEFKKDNDPETNPTMVGCNLPKVPVPSLSFLQRTKILTHSEGIPRSGVYVPERDTRLHSADLHYDSVIQELSMALHLEHMGTDPSSAFPINSYLMNGNQAQLKFGEREIPHETPLVPEAKEDKAPLANNGGRTEASENGDTHQTLPNEEAPQPSESSVVAENVQSKPRRTLKKPERVPSFYKLKLRPKIRPRRDHRPEKKPSKIPTPLAYRYARKTTSTQGQGKAHRAKGQTKNGPATVKQEIPGNTKGEHRLSSTQPVQLTLTEQIMGGLDDKETWL
ncbi:GAS2-like protein 2 [Thamnophis elegans]|uniref:GAS2-like protein 2 n=1 Tax=Thamnophis elegans TaxID=35005 RepID=UPI001376C503|nr:GAS2-like protein 2 [Thamnophis elegans]